MNLLKGTKTYTIGPLQYASWEKAKKWRDKVKVELAPLGIDVLSPLDKVFRNYPQESESKNKELREALLEGRYDYVHKEMLDIRNRDLCCCDISTFLIAVLEPGVPSFGAIDEIITSKRAAKPVFLVIPSLGYAGIPLWLASYFKPEWVYASVDEVISKLKDIDAGKVELDRKYWKIVEV